MKKISLLLIIQFLAFLSLSAQLKKIIIQYPTDSKVKISDSIQSFSIMNRSLTAEYENYNDDSLQVQFYRTNFKTERIILDSLASDTTIKVLAELLFESNRFDVVVPVERNIARFLPYSKTPNPLSWEFVSSVCKLYNTDALIVFENFAVNAVANYRKQSEFIEGDFYTTHFASVDLLFRTQWRIYDPQNEVIISDVIDNDTIFWEKENANVVQLFNSIPSIKQATIEAGVKTAIDFSKLITPRWVSEIRYFYSLDKNVDLAEKHVRSEEWDKALEIWMKQVEVGSKSDRSKVMLNIALANEMLGSFEKAFEWASNAQKIYYREATNTYINMLKSHYRKSLF